MAIRNRRALKEAARQTLEKGNAKRLIVLFTGIHAAFALVIALADLLLQQQIAGTGGLSGMGTRSMLQTVQQVLSLLGTFLPTFWSMGYLYAMLKLSHGAAVEDKDLLQGFRCFGPVLRLTVLQTLLLSILGGILVYLFSTLLSFTPLAMPFYQVMLPLVGEDTTAMDLMALDETAMNAMLDAVMPLVTVSVVLTLIALLPMIYRLRLSTYYLMDEPEYGALSALVRSSRAMKGHRLQLAALDVSFWWYYLVEALILCVPYLSLLLPAVGVTLPFSGEVTSLIFLAVTLVLQLVLYILARNRVTMTYVQAYKALSAEEEVPTPTAPKPAQKLPWEEPPTQNG